MKDLASTAIETKPNRTTKKNQQTRTANLEAKKKNQFRGLCSRWCAEGQRRGDSRTVKKIQGSLAVGEGMLVIHSGWERRNSEISWKKTVSGASELRLGPDKQS